MKGVIKACVSLQAVLLLLTLLVAGTLADTSTTSSSQDTCDAACRAPSTTGYNTDCFNRCKTCLSQEPPQGCQWVYYVKYSVFVVFQPGKSNCDVTCNSIKNWPWWKWVSAIVPPILFIAILGCGLSCYCIQRRKDEKIQQEMATATAAAYEAGGYPQGAYPPAGYPPGTYPPAAYPPGAYPPQPPVVVKD